jgi:peptidoglycan/LPS O-acetylase OafA/YrhL
MAFEQLTSGEPARSASPDLPRIWIQPHYASFNGIRGLAVFLVFLTHFGEYLIPLNIARNLWFGVDLFFVLSGFLITGILYDSIHDPRFFRNFYIRRALRIFPIFYAFFLLLLLLTPILHLSYPPRLWFFCFYVGNLILPFVDLARHNPTVILFTFHGHLLTTNIGHLWSLCVEEQFYLLWPAVVWLVRSRTRLMHICLAVALAVLCFRVALTLLAWPHAPNDIFMQWSTFTRVDTLLVGAWFALWLREKPLSRTQLHRLSFTLVASSLTAILAGLLLCRFVFATDHIRFIRSVGYTLIALASAGLILRSLDDASRWSRLLRNRALAGLGIISYGFYFIHHLFMYETQLLVQHNSTVRRYSAAIPFVFFALSFLLARLSFLYLESPFLRLKSKWAPQWTPLATSTPTDSTAATFPTPAPLHVSEPRP